MAERTSRTYKLKLSPRGIGLFLDCHGRVCRLICDFLPYGITLQVAVAGFEHASIDEILGDLCSAELPAFGGNEIRYVGASPNLMESTARLAQRIEHSGHLYPVPQIWKIYIAALLHLRSSEDASILRAHAGLSPNV